MSIAFISYEDFEDNIQAETSRAFRVISESRAEGLEVWFDNLGRQVASYGSDPTVVAAVSAFDSAYGLMIDPDGLQAAYINENPNPAGAKDLYDQAPEPIPYHFQHARFHPHFRDIKDSSGFYDFFLFNGQGDLIYSVYKESDYATNFVNGPFASSGLAEVFVRARDGLQGQVYFADFTPYAPSLNAPAGFVATPVVDETGATLGVVAVQIPIELIARIVANPLGLGETGEVYLIGPDLLTRSASRFPDGFQTLADVSDLRHADAALRPDTLAMTRSENLSGETVYTLSRLVDVFDRQWGLISEMTVEEVNAPIAAVRNKMIIVTLLAAGVSIFVGWLAARAFVTPLSRLSLAMRKVSEKDYEITLDEKDRKDEIGVLSNALLDFRDKLRASDAAEDERLALQNAQRKIVDRLSEALKHLSDGDLTHRITTRFDGDYDQLRQDFNETVDTLNATLGSLVDRAGDVRSRAESMSQASDDLSRRTENQAATLEETAAALDEMTASVRSAASGAKEVASRVTDASKDAEDSKPVVQSAVQAMNDIAASSEEISKIIGVIDDIAFQTNLLALNAGVEAARAGEAGRGFAVVASEVRALAQRSSEAAKQIKALISQSAHQVTDGVELVGEAGQVLTRIASHIDHISELIGDIASGAEEQSIGLGEINIGVTQLDKVTQQNAAMVEEQTASSHALNGDSRELIDLVRGFKLEGGTKTLNAFAQDTAEELNAAAHRSDTDAIPQRPAGQTAVSGQAALKRDESFWEEF
ncbi:methyl-accepting chemotaxis protein [Yoonia litorea]|uniref:methyl-accepting chemotaxis protein n=1 Tax=Yoonia litorea TaxID=1123755 RepID=UPI0013F4E912|nr:methyl-accepting chemotaxis protein [Yoonia litorea]